MIAIQVMSRSFDLFRQTAAAYHACDLTKVGAEPRTLLDVQVHDLRAAPAGKLILAR